MDLKPVIWISSVDHLKLHKEFIKNLKYKNKIFYSYSIPEDFPKTNRMPLTYFSSGELEFLSDELLYQSNEVKDNFINRFFGGVQYNLRDLSFTLKPCDIKSIEWYDYKNPANKRTEKWIRIICNEYILNGDFLISTEGKYNTQRLFEMLNQFKEEQQVIQSLKDPNSKMIYLSYFGLFLFILSFIMMYIPYETLRSFGDHLGVAPLFLLILSSIILIISFAWYLTESKASRKVKSHWNLFYLIIVVFIWINLILSHFYP